MKGRPPAFQFYANDWLGSVKIALMTPAQEGAYIRLLAYAWNDPDCSIPDDDQELATLSRLGEDWLKGGSSVVRKCFQPHPEKTGKLVNSRLLEERQKIEEWREKSKEGGKKSAEARRKAKQTNKIQRLKGGSIMVEPKPNDTSTLQSSSSISNNNTPSEHSSDKGKSSSPKKTREPNPFYEEFQSAYFQLASCPYVSKQADFIQLAKCKAELADWLTIDRWKIAVRNYFQSEVGEHTLADLSVRFGVFFKSPLDRFKQPIAGNGYAKPEQERRVVV